MPAPTIPWLKIIVTASATGATVALLLARRLLRGRTQPAVPPGLAGRLTVSTRPSAAGEANAGPPTCPPRLERARTDQDLTRAAAAGRLRRPSLPERRTSEESDEESPRLHTADAALRALNPSLMERGRSNNPRRAGLMYGPRETKVIRIALTGGPCAGKSSALAHLIATATAEGFDVLTAPEVATLYFNSSYQFPSPTDPTFSEQTYQFQLNILKLQLQLERCYSSLAGSTGRPTIVVFDRGLRDSLAFMVPGAWPRALAELNKELPNGPQGRITDEYIYGRYDGVIHLVTAADGASEHYKYGIVEDDAGGRVFRRETPGEAVDQDRKLQQAWAAHPHHVVVANGGARGFDGKLEDATEAVLAIARLAHPETSRNAKEIREGRKLASAAAAVKAANKLASGSKAKGSEEHAHASLDAQLDS